jgi:hypothetical protein
MPEPVGGGEGAVREVASAMGATESLDAAAVGRPQKGTAADVVPIGTALVEVAVGIRAVGWSEAAALPSG